MNQLECQETVDCQCQNCLESIAKQRSNDEYYKGTRTTVMIPVAITYHEPTNVVFSYCDSVYLNMVEKALKNKPSDYDIAKLKQLISVNSAYKEAIEKVLNYIGE